MGDRDGDKPPQRGDPGGGGDTAPSPPSAAVSSIGRILSDSPSSGTSSRRRASPSWDLVPDPFLQVNMMFTRDSPKILALSKAAQRVSPKASASKKCGGTSKEGVVERAAWNAELEKTLVDLLFQHNAPPYRAQNGWSPDAGNKIVAEFNKKHGHVPFSKIQIQEKERELKREYKMLKEARKQSGVSWNEQRCMINAEPPIWDNIIAGNCMIDTLHKELGM